MVLGDTQESGSPGMPSSALVLLSCDEGITPVGKFKKKNPITPLKASNEVNTCILAIVGKTYQENRSICSKIP